MADKISEMKKMDQKRHAHELNSNTEEIDKEYVKAIQLTKENELVMRQIQSMSFDLSRLKTEINRLKSELNSRHDIILEKVKRAINTHLAEIIPQNITNKVAYDEDELVTGSEASSVDYS